LWAVALVVVSATETAAEVAVERADIEHQTVFLFRLAQLIV
jgi:hypothetical protein